MSERLTGRASSDVLQLGRGTVGDVSAHENGLRAQAVLVALRGCMGLDPHQVTGHRSGDTYLLRQGECNSIMRSSGLVRLGML